MYRIIACDLQISQTRVDSRSARGCSAREELEKRCIRRREMCRTSKQLVAWESVQKKVSWWDCAVLMLSFLGMGLTKHCRWQDAKTLPIQVGFDICECLVSHEMVHEMVHAMDGDCETVCGIPRQKICTK